MEPIDNGKTFVCNNKQSIGKIFNLHRFGAVLYALLSPIHSIISNQQQISGLARDYLPTNILYVSSMLAAFRRFSFFQRAVPHNTGAQNLFNMFHFYLFPFFPFLFRSCVLWGFNTIDVLFIHRLYRNMNELLYFV